MRDQREYLPDCGKYQVAEDYDLKVIVLDKRMDIVDIDELEKKKGKRQKTQTQKEKEEVRPNLSECPC